MKTLLTSVTIKFAWFCKALLAFMAEYFTLIQQHYCYTSFFLGLYKMQWIISWIYYISFIYSENNLPFISTLCINSQKCVNVSASVSRFTWFSLCLTSNESIRELAVTWFPLPITKTVSQTVGFARIDANNPYVWRPSSSCNNWGNIFPTWSFKQIELQGNFV